MKRFAKNWRNGPKIRVSVADGKIHESNMYCTLEVRIMTSIGAKTIQIDDVLYVENLCSMLLSVSRICQKGYDVKFQENTCEIRGPQGINITITKSVVDTLFRIPILEGNSQNEGSEANSPNMEGTLKMMGAKTTSENIRIWHNALGHPGKAVMRALAEKGKIPKFRTKDIDDVITQCTACNMAKARALPVPEESENRATKVMERIHCDAVTGLPPSSGGKTGFSLIVDEFSKFIDVRLISRKNETQDHIKEFVDRMEALGHRTTKLRTDSAAEFVEDKEFVKWLIGRKIQQEASSPYAKHQNGVMERHIQTIKDRATAILIQSGLSKKFWGDAILSAVVTWNATSNKAKSPLEAVTGRTGDLGMLKPFGCRVYIRMDGPQQRHMEARAEAGIMLGYSSISKGYRVSRDPDWKTIVVRAPRDCMFKEDEFPAINRKRRNESEAGPSIIPGEVKEAKPDPMPVVVDDDVKVQRPGTPPLVIDDRYYSSIFEQAVTQNPRLGLRSGTNHHSLVEEVNLILDGESKEFNEQVEICDAIDDMIIEHIDNGTNDRNVPRNIQEAMRMPEAMEAAQREIDMIKKFQTWKLVPITDVPKGTPIYAPIWRFSRKADGRMKARLCFPGHRQRKGVDYVNSSSPTVAMASFRLFLTFCKLRNVTPIHMDIRNAYLHAKVTEDVYMRQPPGFVDEEHPNHVCKLMQSLYGMHQSGHNWHNLIDADLVRHGLRRSEHDPCVYYDITDKSKWLIICLYVDDLLIGGDAKSTEAIIKFLRSKYSVSSEGKISRYLGISVKTDGATWKLDQSIEIEQFLRENGMDTANPVDRPGDPSLRYEEACKGPKVNQPQYRSVIGGLLWFAIATQPDIMYAVNIVAQFQQSPTTRAWTAVKRILRYLRGTLEIGVIIDPKNNEMDIFSDANHGDQSLDDRKSISGGAYYLGGSLVHWTCRKQRTPAHSLAESELVRASDVIREGIWLLRLGEILGTGGPLRMHMDNKAARDIAESKGLTRRVKHLEIRDAYIRILRERGIVTILQVRSDDNRADVLTKAFGSPAVFMNARNNLFGSLRSESAGECYGDSSSHEAVINSDVSRALQDADIHGHSGGTEQCE